MRITIQSKIIDFYLCFGKVYDITKDEFFKKEFRFRFGKLLYTSDKGWKKINHSLLTI